MYSSEIVEKRLYKAKKSGLKFTRLPRQKSLEIAAHLELLRYTARKEKLPEGQLIRDLTSPEKEFIESERILCCADFSYYFSRYHIIERDPGVGTESGNGPARLLDSQRLFIKKIGEREEICYAEVQQHGFTAGILVYAHKCRQVGYTATARAMTVHRMLFYPGTRCFAATLREGPLGTGELYKRDLLAINSLPFWLKPSEEQVYPKVKDQEIGFQAPFHSRVAYQAENQQTGIGTGTQQDVTHLTEVSLWSYPGRIRFSFMPSIPKAVTTLSIQEATSAGKGDYWHEVTESCRRKKRGYENYIYVFCPWWVNTTKYRAVPSPDWKPEHHTIQHAELIERTSPEFNGGITYCPSVEQLYWWETTRAEHYRNGEGASFLANYPATPEQSFVNAAQGALPIELIEEMELGYREPGGVYEISVI